MNKDQRDKARGLEDGKSLPTSGFRPGTNYTGEGNGWTRPL